MTEKEYKTWLILDWKKNTFRVLKKLNIKYIKPTEVPIDLSIKMTVPETPILKAQGEIKLSQPIISQMIIAEIADEPATEDKI